MSHNSRTTANDNTARDLHRPACQSAAARRAVHRRVRAGPVSGSIVSFSELPCRESRFSRRCFASRAEIPNADAPEAALTAVKREKQQICLQKNTLTCFFIQDVSQYIYIFNLSPSALKSISIFIVIRLLQFMCKCIQKCEAVM